MFNFEEIKMVSTTKYQKENKKIGSNGMYPYVSCLSKFFYKQKQKKKLKFD